MPPPGRLTITLIQGVVKGASNVASAGDVDDDGLVLGTTSAQDQIFQEESEQEVAKLHGTQSQLKALLRKGQSGSTAMVCLRSAHAHSICHCGTTAVQRWLYCTLDLAPDAGYMPALLINTSMRLYLLRNLRVKAATFSRSLKSSCIISTVGCSKSSGGCVSGVCISGGPLADSVPAAISWR